MGSALLDTTSELASAEVAADTSAAARPASSEALRLQVAERLAAHRSRRGHVQVEHARIPSQPSRSANARSAQIAAAVAERYAHSQSYRAFLAAEAERATQQARAAAEVAALNAQAVAAAQQRLLEAFEEHAVHADEREIPQVDEGNLSRVAGHEDQVHAAPSPGRAPEAPEELSLWPEPEGSAAPEGVQERGGNGRTSTPKRATAKTPPSASVASPQSSTAAGPCADGFTVRPYEDAARASRVGVSLPAFNAWSAGQRPERNEAEALALDEEIAFRQAPVFEEPAGPPVPLPANLIEFPRQLVASRKARPRYAEGPLRDEADIAAGDGQLRIFEVDVAQISTEPDAAAADMPQWTSIWLDTPLGPAPEQRAAATEPGIGEPAGQAYGSSVPFPQAASIGRRTMAAAINAAIVFAALVGFAAAFAMASGHSLSLHAGMTLPVALRGIADALTNQTGLQPGAIAGACVLAAAFLSLLYQALFFSFSQATPGMRCARIALCTFDDENPTRSAVRRRLLAVLLSACPLGMGFAWAALDEDRLTWHDRISRTYQRMY